MKVKYTGLTKKIFTSVKKPDGEMFMRHFVRNEWTDIEDEFILKYLLSSPYFLCEDDLLFRHGDVNTPILLKRGYALGDLIMLIPVIKYMKRKFGYRFHLITSDRFVKIMEWFNVFEKVFNAQPAERYNKYYVLDGVLEADHSNTNHEREMHRIKIYENFFNICIDYYDFRPDR